MLPTTIDTILNGILTAAEVAFAQPGANPAPSRTFITHGLTPVWEGEQLTVTSLGVSAVHPFPLNQVRGVKTTIVPSLGVSVEIVRACWPLPRATSASKSLPDPTKLTTAALSLAKDAACLYGYIAQQITAGTLLSVPTIGTATDYQLSPMVPTGPNGDGLAGWRLPMAIKLSVAGP